MRLIDVDALKTNCRITGEFINNFECVSLATLKEIIDRQPTIDPVKHGYVPLGLYEQDKWERDMAISQLNSYGIQFGEKVDVQKVKHGKWIKKTWHGRGGYRYLKCECGKELCIEKPIDDIVDTCSECGKINESSFFNYCPNCGTRMDKEE